MNRTILHADCNNFYASVECLYDPSLHGKPVAVAGDPDARHGIVLAKNYAAKSRGVATGNPLWLARQRCPDIVFVPPHFELYHKFSRRARRIYCEYTDRVEPFGLDECWLDVTGSERMFGDGRSIADELRLRVRRELGITISVGVSFNKVFAKLGSDMKKPDATTVIDSDHFKETIWDLPVGDLLFVGSSTQKKLTMLGVSTIGDLARADARLLERVLGKNGVMLWTFANGLDSSPVSAAGSEPPVKSIGNSTTTPRDLCSDDDVKLTLYMLAESVSSRLRAAGAICRTVTLFVRDSSLFSFERQARLPIPNRTSQSLFDCAFALYLRHKTGAPIRSLGIRASELLPCECEQLSFMPDVAAIQRRETIDAAVDGVRRKFGQTSILRGTILCDKRLASSPIASEHPFSRL